MPEESNFYEESKTRVLDNDELAIWLRHLDDRLRKLEASLSLKRDLGSKRG